MITLTKGTTVTLPDPEHGNTTSLDTFVINRDSRYGEPLGYRDATWPTRREYRYTFNCVTKAEAAAFKEFVTTNTGLLISVTDHNSETFDAYILAVSDFIKVDSCTYKFGFSLWRT